MYKQLENVLKFVIWITILSFVTNLTILLTVNNIYDNIKELEQPTYYTEFTGEVPKLPELPM